MNILGYKRPDGRYGIRNKVLILPISTCATDTACAISRQVEGTVSFHNQNGCSQVKRDQQYTLDVIAGFAANPNVYGTIIIGLGCETLQADMVSDEVKKRTNKPLETFVIQQHKGTVNTIRDAVIEAQKMVAAASMLQKEPFPISQLILGTECGGSDQTSGLASNPAIGKVCDKLVGMGGTAVLSETTEFIGGEHILASRGKTKEISDKIFEIVHNYEQELKNIGVDVREGNPSPGNMEGGITTLEEKSLGCIHKGGSTSINEVYSHAQQMDCEKGLVIMDTPSNDPVSVAGMIAGGAQVVVFSTGRGTPTGNPIAPVIKVTANKFTYENMKDNIDFDLSAIIDDPDMLEEESEKLFKEIVDTANGKLTKSELLGFIEIGIPRYCNYV